MIVFENLGFGKKKEVLETTKRGGVLVFTGQFYLLFRYQTGVQISTDGKQEYSTVIKYKIK